MFLSQSYITSESELKQAATQVQVSESRMKQFKSVYSMIMCGRTMQIGCPELRARVNANLTDKFSEAEMYASESIGQGKDTEVLRVQDLALS